MKHYDDFKLSGESFAERIGEPDEFDAAIGHLALGFSFLEDTAHNVIVLLSGTKSELGHIMAAGLSFRQKLDVVASLARHHLGTLNKAAEDLHGLEEWLGEILWICRRSEELRNTYMHSSYSGRRRAKFSANAYHGLRVHLESVDAALLLDVSDFIVSAGMELEGLPLLLDIADMVGGTGDCIKYEKKGAVVATFRFGEVA
jgi:hypothetical protein